jgi:hypothetical protein
MKLNKYFVYWFFLCISTAFLLICLSYF